MEVTIAPRATAITLGFVAGGAALGTISGLVPSLQRLRCSRSRGDMEHVDPSS